MHDEQAEAVALAALTLAVTVRDEGPAAARHAATELLRAAGGDPIAALAVTAALIDTDRPANAWWQDHMQRPPNAEQLGQPGYLGHGTHAGYARHRRAGDDPCAACAEGERLYRAEQHQRRKTERSAAA